jgi:hypothetical protein
MGLLMNAGIKPLKIFATLYLFVIAFALLLGGCAKEPTPVGAKLLPSSDLIDLDTLYYRSVRCYSNGNITQTASSFRVLVGNLGTLQSWGMYRFSYLPDSVKYMPFVSAELNLRTLYHFGDSLAPFSFTVHPILQGWSTDSLTIDSLRASGFYNQIPCGTYSAASLGDTISISVPLDTATIRGWGTGSDTVVTNFGLLLKPTNTGVVKGFGSFTISDETMIPELLLRLRDIAGNIDTLIVKLGTTRFVTTGPNPLWPSDSAHVYVMNGTSSRGYIEFNVSNIPAHAAVHKAILELTPDTRLSQTNYFTVDSLEAYYTSDDGVTYSYLSGPGGPVQIGTSRVYQFSIGSLVQHWVRGAKYQRTAIIGYTESSSLDLFTFYGTSPDVALRPKLTVIYSLIQ